MFPIVILESNSIVSFQRMLIFMAFSGTAQFVMYIIIILLLFGTFVPLSETDM